MTTHESEIADRLERAASLIHTSSRLSSITGLEAALVTDRSDENSGWVDATDATGGDLGDELAQISSQSEGMTSDNPRGAEFSPRSWQRIVAVAAAAGIIFTGVVLASRFGSDNGQVRVAARAEALVEFDLDVPAPVASELLPLVANPPAAFGEGQRAEREGQQRTGQWSSAAIARTTVDGYEQPIVVSVLRGDAFYLSETTPLGSDLASPAFGDLVSFTDGPWTAVATKTNPIVTISGAVELSTLLDVLNAMTPSESSPGNILLDTVQLPEAYVLIVEPTALGQDRTPRKVLADDFRAVSINEISDRVDPLLAASFGGGRLRNVNVGTTPGWTSTYDNQEFGPLRSLIWAPEPGVVLELSVVAERWNLDDSITLAEGITMTTRDQWSLRYPD